MPTRGDHDVVDAVSPGTRMTAAATTRVDPLADGGPPLAGARRLPEIPPEEELLLLSAGGPANDRAIHDITRGSIDWQRFLGLAQFERAVPVVYPRLKATAGATMPADVLDQMRRLALVSDFAMMHLETRLRDSLRVLHDAGIRVMLLKGAALAHTVYGGVRHRPMSDVDLLVDPSTAHKARRLLLAAGWGEIVGGIPESVYDRHHHLPPLRDARAPDLQVEIHTALFPERQPFAFDARDLWAHAQPLGGEFPDVFVPDRVHSLLHACLHFLWSHQGRFGVWRTIRDVDAITRAGAIDWSAFIDAARATRGATSCYWTFRITEVASGVRVPDHVLRELQPPRRPYMLRAIERHFVRNLFPVDFACPSVTLDHMLWELAVMPGWSGHGEVRPWDEEPEFAIPSSDADADRILPKRERVRRLLASPGYIRALLRDPHGSR
jgi:putative nucleotidyltransferase-like protein